MPKPTSHHLFVEGSEGSSPPSGIRLYRGDSRADTNILGDYHADTNILGDHHATKIVFGDYHATKIVLGVHRSISDTGGFWETEE